MKKIIYLFSAVALLCGCEREDLVDQLQEGIAGDGAVMELPEEIYAAMADDDHADDEEAGAKADKREGATTRTYVENKKVLWHGGDEIAYFGPSAFRAEYKYEGEDGVSSARFKCIQNGSSMSGLTKPSLPLVVYPFTGAAYYEEKGGEKRLVVNFPATQTYAPNSFARDANVMVAAGETADDTDFYFRNACGYLVIKLYSKEGIKIRNIALTALGGENITGQGYIIASPDAEPRVRMANLEKRNTVTLNCGDEGVALGADKANATEFWFALPPVTFEKGFKIVATPTQGSAFTVQTSKKVAITRNDIQPMAVLEFAANTQSDYQLFYTRAESTEPFAFSNETNNPFDANIVRHYYDKEKKHFVIEFDRPLTTIKESAFSGSKIDELIGSFYGPPSKVTDITSVSFPKTLKTIGKFAFAGTALRELTIPGNVTQVGYYAFWECRQLERVSMLEGDEPLMVVVNAIASARGPFGFSPLQHIYINRDIDYRDYDHYTDRILESEFGYQNVDEGLFSLSADSETGANRPGIVDEVTVEIGPKLSIIYPYMFAYRNIKSITIPSNVTHIGEDAFFNCDDLESVTINSPQATIDRRAFWFNDKLKTVDISAYRIGEVSFRDCPGLESVTIRGTVEVIDNDAFYNCKSLKSLTLEPSPTGTPLTLGYQTFGTDDQSPFYDATLETLNWNRALNYALEEEGSIDAVNEGLFSGNPNLSSVTIGEQVTGIPHYTFAESGLPSVTIPGTVTSIGKYAFYDCDNLESIDIPATVNTVDYGAFYDCNKLTEATVASGVATMGEYVFYDCDALQKAYLGATTIDAGVLYDCDALEALTIGGTVNTIGKDAFYSCGALKNVTFSPSSTNEGLKLYCQTYGASIQGPFHDAPLVSANWDRTISLYGNSASVLGLFEGKSALTSVTIGSQVQKIPLNTFKGAGLTSITIPANVSEIECDAFLDCDALHTVIISPSGNGLALYHQSDDYGPFYDSPLSRIELGRTISSMHGNQLFSPSETKAGVFASEESVDEVIVTIGSNVSMVGPYMFNGLNIKSIEIPSSVGEVSHNAFNNCDKLTTVTVGAQIVSKGAFYDCDALNTVTIKGTVNTIGNDVFYSCGKIKNVTFEESTTGSTLTLGYQTYGTGEEGPFYDSNLETVVWRRNISYTLANRGSADQTDEGIFSQNSALTSVTIGDQVKSIPPYTFAASGLSGSVWIPHTVESIGDYAFYDCDKLGGLTLGYDGTTPFPSIGTDVFDDCGNFTYIKVRNRVHEQFESAAENNASGWGAYGDYLLWDTNLE